MEGVEIGFFFTVCTGLAWSAYVIIKDAPAEERFCLIKIIFGPALKAPPEPPLSGLRRRDSP